MIITHGDVLDTHIHIIAHQVNCKGVMGGGLAKTIKDRYPEVFDVYKEFIDDYWAINNEPPLGASCTWAVDGHEIWNIFGQDDYGRDKCYTDYQAVKDAFTDRIISYRELEDIPADYAQMPIAIPYLFGCGLAGGDWSIMKKTLEEIEKEQNVIFVAYKYS